MAYNPNHLDLSAHGFRWMVAAAMEALADVDIVNVLCEASGETPEFYEGMRQTLIVEYPSIEEELAKSRRRAFGIDDDHNYSEDDDWSNYDDPDRDFIGDQDAYGDDTPDVDGPGF